MKNTYKYLLLLILVILTIYNVDAQCPMCSMTAETNMMGGGRAGKGLNNGILYLLMTPYILVGGIAYYWFKNRRKDDIAEPMP